MKIFGKSKEDGSKLALVFDIGSYSVGGAVFYLQKSGSPKIIYSVRELIPFEKELDFDKFLNLTIKSLEKVANKISIKGLGVPEKIFCVLASPWYASQTRVINLDKNTPFTFTSKFADSLIQKEIKFFEEENLEKYLSEKEVITSIELKNMKTILDGESTNIPINQKTKKLEMMLFLSMSPEKVLSKIRKVIERHHHTKEIKFSSFAMASFCVARDMFINQDDFLLVDIGGEITDISMVKKDILLQSISFPIGRNYITRGVVSTFGCTFDEAKSYISLYKDGHMNETLYKKFRPIIEQLKNDWLEKFQESLVNLAQNISIPATIFLTTEDDLVNFYSEIIKNEKSNLYNLDESKFRVIFLGTKALHGIAIFKENVIRDPFIIIETIYLNRFIK